MPPATYSRAPEHPEAPRFPILSLDEATLVPALAYVFNPKWVWPHESILSILWKFVVANRLPGHLVAHQVNANVDPYEGVLPRLHFVDIPRLSQMVAISPRVIRRSLLAGSEHRQCCSSFKYCRLCSGLGYHTVLFQRPNESICPVHKIPLGMACRTCGLESPYVINASVLEMPFRCPACRSRYGSSFSISNLRPMRREGRIAIHRRCIARAVA
jgi:hypothetical protein